MSLTSETMSPADIAAVMGNNGGRNNGDSEFLKAVDGRKAERVWKLVDELVEAVKILHPRMYTTFIDKVQDL